MGKPWLRSVVKEFFVLSSAVLVLFYPFLEPTSTVHGIVGVSIASPRSDSCYRLANLSATHVKVCVTRLKPGYPKVLAWCERG